MKIDLDTCVYHMSGLFVTLCLLLIIGTAPVDNHGITQSPAEAVGATIVLIGVVLRRAVARQTVLGAHRWSPQV
jgi:hypothetical protein